MSRRLAVLAAALCALALCAPGAASAAPKPAWKLTLTPVPDNFAPGKDGQYFVIASNVGAEATTAPYTLKATLPEPLVPFKAIARDDDPTTSEPPCAIDLPTRTVTCTATEALHPGRQVHAVISFSVPGGASEETVSLQASAEGGGATTASQEMPAPISAQAAQFGFLPGDSGLSALFGEEDGLPATAAGSHPFQAAFDLGFPTEAPGALLTGAGHLRDLILQMPRGLSGDPGAVPVLCTEVKLTSIGNDPCPAASQVGVVKVTSTISAGEAEIFPSSLYAMVPPAGAAAEFAFEVSEGATGIFVHVLASVRTAGDYGIDVSTRDVLALATNPIFNAQTVAWGDPSSDLHNQMRGQCFDSGANTCSVTEQGDAFLAMPGDCPGTALPLSALADSWEEEGNFREGRYEASALEGCNALEFQPTIEARPTTNLADSPSGFDFHLKQPQDLDKHHLYTAALKDLSLSLPAGLQVNASAAAGQGVCTPGQAGLQSPVGVAPAKFDGKPSGCPDAAKLGSVKAITPLLAQRGKETHEVELDPETHKPRPEVLHGSVYLAQPFQNPFGSLIAIYVTIEDPTTGIFATLASEVTPDPVSGQLSTTVTESPQLPVEDFKVHIFGGARGSLQTPATCATYTTTSRLTPWSAPEGKDAEPEDSFVIDHGADGGPCPASQPNSPGFTAGTISPQAAKFSPLLFKVSREDGSQRLSRFEATMPPGLTAKLAGVGECTDAQIAAAISRSHPNEGALEQASPSCPASSQVGVIDAAAGAGPTPLHVQGHLYLAGPYEGAPYSAVAITPAIAGPFDLGNVVVRARIDIDPVTGQARIASDPFPQILDGIPVDVRSVTASADRANFSLNPSSCNVMAFSGSAISTLGQVAPLSERFQVGGCKALPYKPKLSARLTGPTNRGAHPSLRSVFQAKPGEANTARISVALPHSEFIDQAHFRTICTRVQFAAQQCPKGSIYGYVKAKSPLIDYMVEGPIYLRSSSHELPDVVLALKGPPSQPVEIDADGRVDSVGGGLRVTFDGVPDLPVSKAIVTMQGGSKGLFQNSTNLCVGTHRLTVKLTGQNGKAFDNTPKLNTNCPKLKKQKGHRHRR